MNTSDQVDLLVKVSRRSLWVALFFVLLYGCYGIVMIVLPDDALTQSLSRMIRFTPPLLVAAIAWIQSSLHESETNAVQVASRIVQSDELRHASLNKAYRIGFLTALLCQPVMLLLLAWLPLANAHLLVACVTATLSISTLLGSFLYFDRG